MKRIELTIELEYDAEIMHGTDAEAKEWFFNQILHKDEGKLYLHSNEIGDTIGKVIVKEIAPKPQALYVNGTIPKTTKPINYE